MRAVRDRRRTHDPGMGARRRAALRAPGSHRLSRPVRRREPRHRRGLRHHVGGDDRVAQVAAPRARRAGRASGSTRGRRRRCARSAPPTAPCSPSPARCKTPIRAAGSCSCSTSRPRPCPSGERAHRVDRAPSLRRRRPHRAVREPPARGGHGACRRARRCCATGTWRRRCARDEITEGRLVELIVGQPLASRSRRPACRRCRRPRRRRARRQRARRAAPVRGVSFSLRHGEVLGHRRAARRRPLAPAEDAVRRGAGQRRHHRRRRRRRCASRTSATRCAPGIGYVPRGSRRGGVPRAVVGREPLRRGGRLLLAAPPAASWARAPRRPRLDGRVLDRRVVGAPADGHALGRQPAEGRGGALAPPEPEGAPPRRADPRRRRARAPTISTSSSPRPRGRVPRR